MSIPSNSNNIVISKNGELSSTHSYNGLIKALDDRLTAVKAEQASTLEFLKSLLDTLVFNVRGDAIEADRTRARIVRRDSLKATEFGNCKCGGGFLVDGDEDANMPNVDENDYNCNKDSTSGSGCSSLFVRKGHCPDGSCHNCAAGSLFQFKCTKKANSDSHWKTAAALDTTSIEGGTPAEFQTSIETFDAIDPTKITTHSLGELPSAVTSATTILLSDENGNLTTISCESTLVALFQKIKQAQTDFARDSAEVTKLSSFAKKTTNVLSTRIKSTLSGDNDPGILNLFVPDKLRLSFGNGSNFCVFNPSTGTCAGVPVEATEEESELFRMRSKDLRRGGKRGPYGF